VVERADDGVRRVAPGLLRLAVGLEDAQDLADDLDQALDGVSVQDR
jgi:cystathionine beta-lyase/cystathionine gamma-synthase